MKFSVVSFAIDGNVQQFTVPIVATDATTGVITRVERVVLQPVGAACSLCDPTTTTIEFPIADGASFEINSSSLPGTVIDVKGTNTHTLRIIYFYSI
jgi:hypothetical protein